ncbi:MAG: DUF411 domain-containing protein [Nanoarchaeota archaeon]
MKLNKLKWYVVLFFLLAVLVLAGCSKKAATPDTTTDTANVAASQVTLFKSQSCGCCDLYLRYMEKNDYAVTVNQVDDLSPVKDKYHIPQQMQSCHTSVIGNYFVEGHMPTEAIVKLMAEKPDIAGIALPGMPSGSPGMPGSKQGRWTIYAVGKDGSITEFMKI